MPLAQRGPRKHHPMQVWTACGSSGFSWLSASAIAGGPWLAGRLQRLVGRLGPFESLETSLTTFNDAVVQEHEKASEMLTKNNGDGEKEIKEKENGAKQEGAMFAKNVGRAEAIKGRNCNALNTLEEISSMLRRRLVEARSHEVELSNAPPAVSQSLQRAIANLEHHEQHVMEVEGEMRMKCADATSFARQTKQEAMVAAAMRMGNFTTNAMNGTNL